MDDLFKEVVAFSGSMSAEKEATAEEVEVEIKETLDVWI